MSPTRIPQASRRPREPAGGPHRRFWRVAGFAYGLCAYACFVVTFVYTVGFVSAWGVPKSIDRPVSTGPIAAITIDVLLIAAFGLQHTVMARRGFKQVWQRVVPAPLERSTYVLASCAALGLLFWQWRPVDIVVWHIGDPRGRVVMQSLLVCGWLLVLIATALINHADLFGLRQTWTWMRGRKYLSPNFVTPGPYDIVRHPLYLGWIGAFWATPHMTLGHFVFAALMTAYVRAAIAFEERDLIVEHGRKYRAYRQRVPMLVPFARPARTRRRSARG